MCRLILKNPMHFFVQEIKKIPIFTKNSTYVCGFFVENTINIESDSKKVVMWLPVIAYFLQ